MHKTIRRLCALAVVTLCSAAAQAQSLTINFDNLSSPADALPFGLQLSHNGGADAYHYVLSGGTFLAPPVPFGKFLAYYALESQSESLSLASGSSGTFTVNGVDLAGVIGAGGFQSSDLLSIQITGTRFDGTTVTAQQRFDLTAGSFTNFGREYFDGFTGLTSLQFSGTGTNYARYVGIDNLAITLAPVPEPETYALLLAGLGLVAAVARKRKPV